MFKKVLCALKFSPASRFALSSAVDVCRQSNAHLSIFHALDYHLLAHSPGAPDRERAAREAQARFAEQIIPLLGDFSNFSFSCTPADAALEICRMARENGTDLIVIGCHQGKPGRSMGRVDLAAMTIFENAPCKIMLVPFRE